jgi:ubiquinone/menaquinone biosynthesis C-methylase UbiE
VKASKKGTETSWDRVADWYRELLGAEGTYQKELILPNLLRLMDIRQGDAVLDLACGPGFFAREFAARGARVTGVDSSRKLIEAAGKNVPPEAGAKFFVSTAEKLPFIKEGTIDKIAIVLALQNIENVADVLRACAKVLAPDGRLAIVMNHPAFRVPKHSAWEWDAEKQVQYRRIDRYLSELKIGISMYPGARPGSARAREETISFHRPLQYYFKALCKAGFAVSALEEWNSNRTSEPGPRAKAEDLARKEIPMFICLIAENRSASLSRRTE